MVFRRSGIGIGLLLCWSMLVIGRQEPAAPAGEKDPKAIELIKLAIAARGGDRYLSSISEVGRGEFTPFKDGVSTIPVEFVDSILYPDRERTQFGRKGSRIVQTNTGASGWIFDAAAKSLKEQTDELIREHQDGMKFSLDSVLKSGWKDPAVTVKYQGKKEAWRLQWGEAIEMLYPGGNRVQLYLSTANHLPFLFIREHDNSQGGRMRDEDRYSQWVDRGGIMAPNIIDHYTDDVQSSRIHYSSLEYNAQIDPKIFEQPASVKDVGN